MDVTLIPTPLAINEWMREATVNAILALCQQNQFGPADLIDIANQLAQREAAADALTEQPDDYFACN
ncbi:hypothetical protein AAFN90_00690 [Erwiniaceae bacterium CAU 1747]